MRLRFRVHVFSIVIFSLLAGCQSNPNKEDGGGVVSYSVFYDQGDHLRSLIKNGDFRAAASLYGEYKSEFFDDREEKYKPDLARVADALNEELSSSIAEGDALLGQLTDVVAEDGDWDGIRSMIERLNKIVGDYNQFVLLRDPEYRSSDFWSLYGRVDEIKSLLVSRAPNKFANYEHLDRASFFDVYPVKIDDRKGFLEENHPLLKEYMKGRSPADWLRLRDVLSNDASSDVSDDDAGDRFSVWVANGYVTAKLNGKSGYQVGDVLGAISEARALGMSPSKAGDLKFAMVEATSKSLLKGGQIEFGVGVENDLGLDVEKVSMDRAFAAGNPMKLDYVIVFDINTSKTERRIIKRDKNESKYVSGYQQVQNPDYESVRMNAYQAQANLVNAQSQFCQGWGCVAKAILVGTAEGKFQALQRRLADTPMMLKEPIYQKYDYSSSNLEVRKVVSASFYVADIRRGKLYRSAVDVSENESFSVAYNVHKEDESRKNILDKHDSEERVSSFEEDAVTLPLSSLLKKFVKDNNKSKDLPGLMGIRKIIDANKNTYLAKYNKRQKKVSGTTDPRLGHVVVVYNPEGGLGTGFFVAQDLVLTNYHVVEGSKYMELKMYNGLETFGKVVKTDVRLDLALVKTQAKGKPVEFFDSEVPIGEMVEAVGHPKGLEFSVTRGVVSALRKRPSVYDTGGKDVLFVQTDTPINPGNSGGPLFLGSKVIAVNNNKIAANAVEGIGFSIHVSEVENFLREDF